MAVGYCRGRTAPPLPTAAAPTGSAHSFCRAPHHRAPSATAAGRRSGRVRARATRTQTRMQAAVGTKPTRSAPSAVSAGATRRRGWRTPTRGRWLQERAFSLAEGGHLRQRAQCRRTTLRPRARAASSCRRPARPAPRRHPLWARMLGVAAATLRTRGRERCVGYPQRPTGSVRASAAPSATSRLQLEVAQARPAARPWALPAALELAQPWASLHECTQAPYTAVAGARPQGRNRHGAAASWRRVRQP